MQYCSDCGDPSPMNGTANIPSGTTYEKVAFIECDEGYTLQGEQYVTCEDGGAWSSNPTCVYIGKIVTRHILPVLRSMHFDQRI